MSGQSNNRTIVKREVRYAFHVPRTNENEDLHYVKEQVTYSDGTRVPKVSLISNYTRPIWATKPTLRNHFEKKEFEHVDNLIRRECTDSDLNLVACNMLDIYPSGKIKDKIKQSPYIYGYDIPATNFIKLESLQRNNFVQSPYTIATFDIETSMKDRSLICASVVMFRNGKLCVHGVVRNDWLDNLEQRKKKIINKVTKHYSKLLTDLNVELEVVVNDHSNEIDMLKDIFRVCNYWAPDWLSIWNINFDINEIILSRLEHFGVDPIDIFCDPKLPREARRFRYVESPKYLIKADGKKKNFDISERWHKIYCTARFHFVDAMVVFRALRAHKQKEPNYKLDYILGAYAGTSKMKFEEADHLTEGSWHEFLQDYYKEEYVAYNFADNVEPLMLDRKTKDLSMSLPIFAEMNDFVSFNSSVQQSATALFIYGLSHDLIVGVGTDMNPVYAELAKKGHKEYAVRTMSVDEWIQTIPQDNNLECGITPFVDYCCLITNARSNVVDMDSISSYPSCIIAGNVSKGTLLFEFIYFKGISESETKELLLGAHSGKANTIEFCCRVYGLPKPEEVVDMIDDGSFEKYLV